MHNHPVTVDGKNMIVRISRASWAATHTPVLFIVGLASPGVRGLKPNLDVHNAGVLIPQAQVGQAHNGRVVLQRAPICTEPG